MPCCCKTRASVQPPGGAGITLPALRAFHEPRPPWPCRGEQAVSPAGDLRSNLTQGFHGLGRAPRRRHVVLGLLPWSALPTAQGADHGAEAAWAAARGPGPEALASDAWWWPGAAGETDAGNRGHTVALVAARHQGRLWAVGSGPTPRLGAAWARWLHSRSGLSVHALMSPWAHAEAVLGARGMRASAHWAHVAVARAMREQCAHCEARLRVRLGVAVSDMGRGPVIDLPEQHLVGESGDWGPWRWRRLGLAAERSLWVARWRDRPWWLAAGLLWADGPPDLRDADLAAVLAATVWLQRASAEEGAGLRWLPTQGPAQTGPALLEATVAYWRGLRAAVQQRQDQGGQETDPPGTWPGLVADWAAHPRHALNWQRAWRQLEAL